MYTGSNVYAPSTRALEGVGGLAAPIDKV